MSTPLLAPTLPVDSRCMMKCRPASQLVGTPSLSIAVRNASATSAGAAAGVARAACATCLWKL